MRTFIQRSACHGHAPKSVDAFNFERAGLLRQLALHRKEPRLISAPSGYGKSSLCASYAKVMFAFKKTFWIDCTSPCFLRDLDSEMLERDMFLYDCSPNLCVFDNVCYLDGARKSKFLKLISCLTHKNVEVLINVSVESKNCFSSNFFTLSSKDLLLTNPEVSRIDTKTSFSKDNSGVACLCFRNSNNSALFSQLQTFGDKLEALTVMFIIYVLESATFKDVFDIIGKRNTLTHLKQFENSYPHFYIDNNSKTFSCPRLSIQEIKEGMNFCYREIFDNFNDKHLANCIETIATKLLSIKKFMRACEFIVSFYDKQNCLDWFIRNSSNLINSYNSSCLKLVLNTPEAKNFLLRDRSRCLKALVEFNNRNNPSFLDHYFSIINSHSANLAQRLFALILYSRIALFEDKQLSIFKMKEIYLAWQKQGYVDEVFNTKMFRRDDLKFIYEYLTISNENFYNSFVFLINKIKESEEKKGVNNSVNRNAIFLVVSWMFDDMSSFCEVEDPFKKVVLNAFGEKVSSKSIEESINYIGSFLNDNAKKSKVSGEFDYYLEFALNSCIIFLESHARDLANLINFESRQFAIELLNADETDKNSTSYLKVLNDLRSKETITNENFKQDLDSHSKVAEFNFFGGCTLKIGESLVEASFLNKKNCILFLFYLCKNIGRVVSRDEIISFIWGDSLSSNDSKRRSFYQVTSYLKHNLNTAFKAHYLKKTSGGFYLDEDLCRCDIQVLDQLCIDLTFSMSPNINWAELYVPLVGRFTKPLLAQIRNNSRAEEFREGYKHKLADALTCAGQTMLNNEDAKSCLWFAREAKHLTPNREDVYLLIMKAQNLLCQRTEAISTYFECKDFMKNELGLAPAKSMQMLYKEIINN